ncbi:MAG: hypothetical protein KJ725_04595 [Gammaproteobacteria bacterium]|nr:hypothetical protein [Gammaproteobacteria bacterium]
MRRRNREISIFSMSALDLFASALGAFVLLTLILLPYYLKESPPELTAKVAQLREQLTRQQQLLEQQQQARSEAEARARQLQQQVESARQQLAKTFLVIYIRWSTVNHDVDLHVVNPAGIEFNFRQKTHPNHPGELTEDSLVGPGNEVWELHEATPGVYRVYANLYARRGNPAAAEVKGRVFYRDGSSQLKPLRLPVEQQKGLMASITVNADGSVQVD